MRTFPLQNLHPSLDLCTQSPHQEYAVGAVPPTKPWGNLSIRELKPFVRKQNSKGMVGAVVTHFGQPSAFTGGHLPHSPGREVRKRTYATSQHIHGMPALSSHPPDTKDQSLWDIWSLAVLKQKVVFTHLGLERSTQAPGIFQESLHYGFFGFF